MTKTYKGFEALLRMEKGWIQKEDMPFNIYRFEDGVIKAKRLGADRYIETVININLFFNSTFVDYVEPLAVGDIVKITTPHRAFVFGTVDRANFSGPKDIITVQGSDAPHYAERAVRITEEEFKVEQRKEMFRAVGRAVDEFHRGDIVSVNHNGCVVCVEVTKQDGGSAKMVEYRGLHDGYKYACDVTPIKFVTYVDAIPPRRIKVEQPVAPCAGQSVPMPTTGLQNMSAKELF